MYDSWVMKLVSKFYAKRAIHIREIEGNSIPPKNVPKQGMFLSSPFCADFELPLVGLKKHDRLGYPAGLIGPSEQGFVSYGGCQTTINPFSRGVKSLITFYGKRYFATIRSCKGITQCNCSQIIQ